MRAIISHKINHANDCNTAASSLSKLIKPNGFYVVGLELLGNYKNYSERNNAIVDWHQYVIEHARYIGNYDLVHLEKEAMESELNKIADFKV